MITLNFYTDGFKFSGNDEDYISVAISYATYSCISNCAEFDKHLLYYQSGYYDPDSDLTYMKIITGEKDVMREYWLFRTNLVKWCEELYGDKVEINEIEKMIEL